VHVGVSAEAAPAQNSVAPRKAVVSMAPLKPKRLLEEDNVINFFMIKILM